MNIEINGTNYKKEWLITMPAGQSLLSKAKDSSVRPRCTCASTKPSMYIRTRGDIHYLARMPGTASEHADDCQAHIIPNSVYQERLQSAADILPELWEIARVHALPDSHRQWASIRSSLYLAADKMTIDDARLSSRLLIPVPFDKNRATEQGRSNLQFYERHNDEDGGNRCWTLGILKSIEKSKFNYRMQVKHMPRISFWVPNELVTSLPTPDNGDGQQTIVLFVGHPVKSGISVTDIAGMLVSNEFSSNARPHAPLTLKDDKISRVARVLGLPGETPRRDVIEALIDRFLEEKCA